jgi:hypothetical protein
LYKSNGAIFIPKTMIILADAESFAAVRRARKLVDSGEGLRGEVARNRAS